MSWDLHIHSCFSFDGHASVSEICRSAGAHGVHTIAITDHCDMLSGPEGYTSYLAAEQERIRAFRKAEEEYPDVELLFGIELGNPHEFPDRTRKFLEGREFDFVIGAVHFLPDGTDIYKLPYSSAEEIDSMFRAYFISMKELVDMGGFDTLAHLDYPLRVLNGKIPAATVAQYRQLIEPVLEGLVRKDIALEINTRGTYDWQKRVGPEDWVLGRYRELGGKYVTIGSDSHETTHIGAGFREALAALKRNGFDSHTIYRSRQPVQIPIGE